MKTLIAEDDIANAQLLQDILRNYGPIDTESNGIQAFEAVARASADGAPYDLICLDITMPVLDGQTALLYIREMEHNKGVPIGNRSKIVMITGLSDLANVTAAFASQCDAYLTKPIRIEKLLTELRNLSLID